MRNKPILANSNRNFNPSNILLLFLLVQSLITSCDSDSTLIGESLQPLSELMNAYHMDTLTIKAYSIAQNPIQTSNFSLALVGSIMDPYFGSTMASFLSRVRLNGSDTDPNYFAPGPGAMADSIVLTLLPSRFYGDPATKMNLKVYRLSEDILRDSVYYSDHVPLYEPATEHIDTISVTDSLIRFVLDTTFFANTLADIDTIESNEELREHFKGIYVTADPVHVEGEGAILLLDILSYESSMTLYYTKITATDTLHLNYEFLISINSARANMISHDHLVGQFTYLNDTITEDTLIYVQGMGGIYARIDFPYLDNLSNLAEIGHFALNKAEISFKPIEYDDSAFYPPPDKMLLYTKDEEGEFTNLFDFNLGDDYFGGTLDEEDGEYTFNITNHVKEYLFKNIPHSSVYLFVENMTISPERVTLFNGSTPDNIRFRIIYTLL